MAGAGDPGAVFRNPQKLDALLGGGMHHLVKCVIGMSASEGVGKQVQDVIQGNFYL